MLDVETKLLVLDQAIANHEVDLYRKELDLKIAKAAGRADIEAAASKMVADLTMAIALLEAEKEELGAQ